MKFVIGCLHSGNVDGHFFHSLTHLLTTQLPTADGKPSDNPLPIDDIIMVRSGPALQLGRGVLCNAFIESTDADAILLLDTDMSFTPQMIHQMWDLFCRLPDIEGPHAKILGGLAFIASAPHLREPGTIVPNLWAPAPDGTRRYVQVTDVPAEKKLYKVGATGAACLMIHREVFEKIAEAQGQNGRWWYHYMLEDGDELGEDISFCRRATDAGFGIYIHTGLVFGHTKPIVLDEEDYRASWPDATTGGPDVRPDHHLAGNAAGPEHLGEPDRLPDFPGPRPGPLALAGTG